MNSQSNLAPSKWLYTGLQQMLAAPDTLQHDVLGLALQNLIFESDLTIHLQENKRSSKVHQTAFGSHITTGPQHPGNVSVHAGGAHMSRAPHAGHAVA